MATPNYFTVHVEFSGTIRMGFTNKSSMTMYYNDGGFWQVYMGDLTYTNNTNDVLEVKFRGTNTSMANHQFVLEKYNESESKWEPYYAIVKGCLTSLLDETCPTVITEPYAFSGLFRYQKIGNALNLVLPTNVTPYCYAEMFYGCRQLRYPPTLPALELEEGCYLGMFEAAKLNDVVSISLPATKLAKRCYESMFAGMEADIPGYTLNISQLPATALEERCYYLMFDYCEVLTNAPKLTAKILAKDCCNQMFEYCTRITTAPSLPATTAPQGCYDGMFRGCTNLISIPSTLPATTVGNNAYHEMFKGCVNITTIPELPAKVIGKSCYEGMFQGCTKITTFPQDSLPAMTLKKFCYKNMFNGCTALTKAPILPAPILTEECYNNLFAGCSGLTEVTVCNRYPCVSNFHSKEGWLPDHTGSLTLHTIKVPKSHNLRYAYTQCTPGGWRIEKDYNL